MKQDGGTIPRSSLQLAFRLALKRSGTAKRAHIHTLSSTLTIRPNLQTADEQCGQNVMSVIVRPDTNATASGGHLGMIWCGDTKLSSISRMHDKWLERLGGKQFSNVLRHDQAYQKHPVCATLIGMLDEKPSDGPLADCSLHRITSGKA